MLLVTGCWLLAMQRPRNQQPATQQHGDRIAAMKNFEITCPCCQATIIVDRLNGEVLLHKAKETRGPGGSLDAMVAGLESQKSEAERRFERQLESQKDRARILEEKFKAALEQAEKSDEKYVNPMDMD